MVRYRDLADATFALTCDPAWFYGKVTVQQLPDHLTGRLAGQTFRNRVMFPRQGGPWWVVAHELAHVSRWSETADHGPAWRAEYQRLACLLLELDAVVRPTPRRRAYAVGHGTPTRHAAGR